MITSHIVSLIFMSNTNTKYAISICSRNGDLIQNYSKYVDLTSFESFHKTVDTKKNMMVYQYKDIEVCSSRRCTLQKWLKYHDRKWETRIWLMPGTRNKSMHYYGEQFDVIFDSRDAFKVWEKDNSTPPKELAVPPGYTYNPDNNKYSYAWIKDIPKPGVTEEMITQECYYIKPLFKGFWKEYFSIEFNSSHPQATAEKLFYDTKKYNDVEVRDNKLLICRALPLGMTTVVNGIKFFDSEEEFINWFGEERMGEMYSFALT